MQAFRTRPVSWDWIGPRMQHPALTDRAVRTRPYRPLKQEDTALSCGL